MNDVYITRTGSFLPNDPVDNEHIQDYLGKVWGEDRIREKILRANGIKQRHYALDTKQRATHDVYVLAGEAAKICVGDIDTSTIDYLAAGTTHAPLIAPGLASILHGTLNKIGVIQHPLEINSNAGVCTSGTQAIINAIRAIQTGNSQTALSVGVEQPSAINKSKVMRPPYDIFTMMRDIRQSKWFMSVFLRFMLSDGAGAFLLEPQPRSEGISLKVNWTFSRSFAHEAPLCMQLPAQNRLLSQDVKILGDNMARLSDEVVRQALEKHNDSLIGYKAVLPHLSSYYFQRNLKKTVNKFSEGHKVLCWTNLATAGNTGSASIYIMLDEFIRTQQVAKGDKIILFIPESGQFNFVLISLTVV